MTFPTINAKATHMQLTPELQSLLEQKLTPLGKFLHTHGDERCDVEIERIAEHQSGRIFRVEINLYSGGTMHRVEATEDLIERAIDVARDDLRHELQRYSGKKRSLLQRGRRALKEMLRFGK